MSASSARARNGILPISPAVMKKSSNAHAQPKPAQKSISPKLRLIVRRLPPGLTETEFWTALGAEWKVGAGKVDWAAFKEGKVSKDPAKPSKPGRAYLRVKEQAFLDVLSVTVKQTTFQDGKNTTKDPCLLGPPSLEFAPLNKVPGGRIRHDGRQGTIDQDQEFIDFLQSLTEPTPRPGMQGDGETTKASKETTTPLIQFIKEKKAAKAKEAALAKTAKGRQEAKETKSSKAEQKSSGASTKGVSSTTTEKTRLAKTTHETVKAINKTVTAIQTKGGAQKAEPKTIMTKDTPATQPLVKRERERGNASAAARILQRDLGLLPKESKAARLQRNQGPPDDSDRTSKANLPPSTPVASTSSTSSTATQPRPQPPTDPPTGPRNTRTPSNASTSTSTSTSASTKPPPNSAQRPPKPPPQPSNSAKSAFLKHANPSQGITEDLLRAAFEVFGALTRCEIDKKKGFGYVDFIDTDGLRKAMQASPVKVANGQVVVLENKSKPSSKTGGHAPVAAAANNAPATTTTPLTTDAASTSTPTSTPITPVEPSAPPTAPKGNNSNARGGSANPRGGRGNHFGGANNRGTFGPGGRGAPRGGFRGGRGGASNRGRGGGNNNNNNSSGSSPAQTNATLASVASPAASGEAK